MLRRLTAVGLPLAFIVGCGTSNIDAPQYNPTSGTSTEDATGTEPTDDTEDQVVNQEDVSAIPPDGYYSQLLVEYFRKIDDPNFQLTADHQSTLWLSFGFVEVQRGFGKGESFLLCTESARIGGSDLDPSTIDAITSQVQSLVAAVDPSITITTTKPFAGDYTTAIIGGTYEDLGCRSNAEVIAAGPVDKGNTNLNDTFFVFPSAFESPEDLAAMVVKKMGESYGLGKPSTALQAGPPSYQPIPGLPNLDATLATTPGLNQIAAMGQLLPDLTDASDVDITTLINQLNGVLPAGTALPGFDRIISIIAVANGAGNPNGGGDNGGAVDLDALLDILDPNNLNGGLGVLLGMAGLGDVTTAISIISTLLGGGGAGDYDTATDLPPITKVPDFNTLLSLTQGLPTADLFANLLKSGTVINTNYNGADRNALISMVKVAYAQALQTATP